MVVFGLEHATAPSVHPLTSFSKLSLAASLPLQGATLYISPMMKLPKGPIGRYVSDLLDSRIPVEVQPAAPAAPPPAPKPPRPTYLGQKPAWATKPAKPPKKPYKGPVPANKLQNPRYDELAAFELAKELRPGRSLKAVADEFNIRRVPTKSGTGSWHAAQIGRLLT